MSFTDKKREEIKKYILRKIDLDDNEVISKTMDNFGISITSVKRYLQEAISLNMIMPEKECACGYKLVEQVFIERVVLTGEPVGEDRIFETFISKNLKKCNEEAFRVWQYVCEEMLNNAIEHSRGKNIEIEVHTNALFSRVIITDDGVGTFQTLLEYMEEHGWVNPDSGDALIELYKGKITSNPVCHSGEGIFFSAKMLDGFALWSDSRMYVSGNKTETKAIQSHLLAYASHINKVGTMVSMKLENETTRNVTEVFDMYTDMEGGFIKTYIPVKEACITGEPVARSQARRICNRLEEFKEVLLDFNNVEFVGQGFADEIFRVYATANPRVLLRPVNMMPTVVRMIHHVGRGKLPDNVKLPEAPIVLAPSETM
ncbi:MAG: DUF4325 domain-containing protein [Lachnospiraceae bacterium]|nr:DUF4325 domain-containing protein [Lachnospiraceae bacterium]